MIILTIRTDSPMAEIGLYEDQKMLTNHTWEAHRQLANTIHTTIESLLNNSHMSWSDISGVVVYKGPGSFTGLRIGVSVANSLAYGLSIPVVGTMGKEWCINGLQSIVDGNNDSIVVPEYGAAVHITLPKK